jgi:hypothetical protein
MSAAVAIGEGRGHRRQRARCPRLVAGLPMTLPVRWGVLEYWSVVLGVNKEMPSLRGFPPLTLYYVPPSKLQHSNSVLGLRRSAGSRFRPEEGQRWLFLRAFRAFPRDLRSIARAWHTQCDMGGECVRHAALYILAFHRGAPGSHNAHHKSSWRKISRCLLSDQRSFGSCGTVISVQGAEIAASARQRRRSGRASALSPQRHRLPCPTPHISRDRGASSESARPRSAAR